MKKSKWWLFWDNLVEVFLMIVGIAWLIVVLVLPFVLLFGLYEFVMWLI